MSFVYGFWSKCSLWVKVVITFFTLIFLIFALLICFINPIAKYVIEKYDTIYLGREVKLEKIDINLFKARASVSNLVIFEDKSEQPFFKADVIHTDLAFWKLFRQQFNVTDFHIDNAYVRIVQDGSEFNFDDLVRKFTEVDTVQEKPKETGKPVEWWLHHAKFNNATIDYTDIQGKTKYEIREFNLHCPLLAWNQYEQQFLTDFNLKSGGKFVSDFRMNAQSLDYALALNVGEFNLALFYNYLIDYVNISKFEGLYSCDLKLTGNFNKPDSLISHGRTMLEKFLVTDPEQVPIVGIGSLNVHIDSLNTASGYYDFQNIEVVEPYAVYEMYASGSNYDKLLKITAPTKQTDSTTTGQVYKNMFQMLAAYVGELGKNYYESSYNVDSLSVKKGHIVYRDFTLNEKFLVELEELNINADRFNTETQRVKISLDAVMNKSGKLKTEMSLSPRDYMTMDLLYKLNGLKMSDMNPYSNYYVAHPFWNGTIEFESDTKIDGKHNLVSANVFEIKQVKVGDKLKQKGQYKVPVKLAVGIMRDVNGNIKIDIPVEGNLDDPNYKLSKTIWKTLENLLVKIVTSPYHLLANAVGGNEDDLKQVPFDFLQTKFTNKQLSHLDLLDKVLENKPDLIVILTQDNNPILETEELAKRESKIKYYTTVNHKNADSLSKADWISIENIAMADTSFNKFLDAAISNTNAQMPAIKKCEKLIGKNRLAHMVTEMVEERNLQVTNYMVKEKKIKPERVKIITVDQEKSAEDKRRPRFAIKFSVEGED